MGDRPTISEADLPAVGDFQTFHPFIKGVFSQWHRTPFKVDGTTFSTAEQWMMVKKAMLFRDEEVAIAIAETNDPSEQKRLGQTVRHFDQEVWDEWKIDIVHEGNDRSFFRTTARDGNSGLRRARCLSKQTLEIGFGALD